MIIRDGARRLILMATIFDYLNWRGDISFNEDPFNEVDNLILAELTYTQFDGLTGEGGDPVTIEEVREGFFSTHDRTEIKIDDNPIVRAPLLMDGMVSGQRFAGTELSYYVNMIDTEKDLQMAAVTYKLNDGSYYIAFRGTDNTIVGWKEDFTMSYLPETEGQRRAVEYLNKVGPGCRGSIRVGGHSKGGNFAIYASAFCSSEIRDKIETVYSNDGPGFRNEIMNKKEYIAVLPKVISIVPDTSVVGMLLTSKAEHLIVDSSERGFAQHDGMSWQVMRNRFVPAGPSDLGLFIRNTQTDWLSKLSDELRESFVDTLFSLLEATGMGTFEAMSDSKLKSAESIISAMQELPKKKQKELLQIIKELISSGGKTVFSSKDDRE